MRETVFIKLESPASPKAEWLIAGGLKPRKLRFGNLHDVAKACQNRRVALVIPGSDVLLTEIEIPTHNRQRLLKAAPFALEEFIIDDVENQHFAIVSAADGNRHTVAAIDKVLLDAWLSPLREVGIRTDMVLPDTLLVPASKHWSVVIAREICLVRTGSMTGFNCTPSQFTEYLQLALQHHKDNKPSQLLCWCKRESIPDAVFDSLTCVLEQHQVELKIESPENSLLELYVKHYREAQVINLLNGTYQGARRANTSLQKWRPAAITAGVLLVMAAANLGLEYREMHRNYTQLKAQAVQLFKSTQANASDFSNMRARMATQLQQLRATKGGDRVYFLELLGNVGEAIKNTPTFELTQIHFANSELNLDFNIDETSKIDVIEQHLKKKGLTVKRGASQRGTSGYVSSLKVSGVGS